MSSTNNEAENPLSGKEKKSQKRPLKRGVGTTTKKLKSEIEEIKAQLKEQAELTKPLSEVPMLMSSLMAEMKNLKDAYADKTEDTIVSVNEEEVKGDESYSDLINHANDDQGEFSPEVLSLLNHDEKDVTIGPKISAPVALRVEKSLSNLVSKDITDKIKENLKVPENCPFLTVPRVNNEIYASLPQNQKSLDSKLQLGQVPISKGMISLTLLAEEIAKNSKNLPKEFCEKTLGLCLNGITMLGIGMREMNHKRKQAIRPHIGPQYAGICNFSTETGPLLFGEDLNEKIKTTKSVANVVKQTYQNSGYRPSAQRPFRPTTLNFRGQNRQQMRGTVRGRPYFRKFQHRPTQYQPRDLQRSSMNNE